MTEPREHGLRIECQRLVELLADYLDGVLDSGLTVEVEAHLALCDGCATYLEQLRTTIGLTGRVSPDGLSEQATAELMAAFRGLSRPEDERSGRR